MLVFLKIIWLFCGRGFAGEALHNHLHRIIPALISSLVGEVDQGTWEAAEGVVLSVQVSPHTRMHARTHVSIARTHMHAGRTGSGNSNRRVGEGGKKGESSLASSCHGSLTGHVWEEYS